MLNETGNAKELRDRKVGEPFNPYKAFRKYIIIPEGLTQSKLISPRAKLAWGRLVRYAGKDGRCFPTMKTLGREIGVGERQTQNVVAELERNNLVRRIPRFATDRQTSNGFELLWHELLAEDPNDSSGERAKDNSGEGVNESSPKESHNKKSQFKKREPDLDYPPRIRKKRDSGVAHGSRSKCKQYPRLKEALADYMVSADEDSDRVYPPDRLVVDVMSAACGATEEQVIECLRYLREERGLLPGTEHGPRHFAWFKTVIADHFQQKQSREMVFASGPASSSGSILSTAEIDSMTDVLEIDEPF